MMHAAERAANLQYRIVVRLAVDADCDDFADFTTALSSYSTNPPAIERDGGAMPYSSGTTGQPKGILRALTDDRFGTLNSLETMLRDTYAFGESTV